VKNAAKQPLDFRGERYMMVNVGPPAAGLVLKNFYPGVPKQRSFDIYIMDV